jgi:hypothetical protein
MPNEAISAHLKGEYIKHLIKESDPLKVAKELSRRVQEQTMNMVN